MAELRFERDRLRLRHKVDTPKDMLIPICEGCKCCNCVKCRPLDEGQPCPNCKKKSKVKFHLRARPKGRLKNGKWRRNASFDHRKSITERM